MLHQKSTGKQRPTASGMYLVNTIYCIKVEKNLNWGLCNEPGATTNPMLTTMDPISNVYFLIMRTLYFDINIWQTIISINLNFLIFQMKCHLMCKLTIASIYPLLRAGHRGYKSLISTTIVFKLGGIAYWAKGGRNWQA